MFVIDDAYLALILRFVVDTEDTASTDKQFLQRQLRTMRQYLAQYPKQEQGSRAIEWIEQRAAQYRRDWERNTVVNRTVYLRCADCPLANIGATEQCEIHEQWLYLLHRYLTDKIATRDYIEDSLALLRAYKDQLRFRLATVATDAGKHGTAQQIVKEKKNRHKKKHRKKEHDETEKKKKKNKKKKKKKTKLP